MEGWEIGGTSAPGIQLKIKILNSLVCLKVIFLKPTDRDNLLATDLMKNQISPIISLIGALWSTRK